MLQVRENEIFCVDGLVVLRICTITHLRENIGEEINYKDATCHVNVSGILRLLN